MLWSLPVASAVLVTLTALLPDLCLEPRALHPHPWRQLRFPTRCKLDFPKGISLSLTSGLHPETSLRIIRSPFLPVWRLETGAALVFRVAPPGAPVSRQLCLCWSLVSRCSLPHSDRDHGPVTPGTRTASWPHTLPCVFSTFTSRISGGGDPWTPPSPHASSQCRRTGPTTDLRHPRPNPPL